MNEVHPSVANRKNQQGNTYTKTCTQCQQDKPLEAYYPSDSGKHGRESICKECRKAKRRQRYKPVRPKSIPKKRTRTPPQRRQCLRCSKRQWPSAYCAHSRRPDRLTQLCRKCHVEIVGEDLKNGIQAGQQHLAQERLGDFARQEAGAQATQAAQCPPVLRDARPGKNRPMDSVPASQIPERKVAA